MFFLPTLIPPYLILIVQPNRSSSKTLFPPSSDSTFTSFGSFNPFPALIVSSKCSSIDIPPTAAKYPLPATIVQLLCPAGAFETIKTRTPFASASIAALRPAPPVPITRTSV